MDKLLLRRNIIMFTLLSIVIPIYNEEKTLQKIIGKIESACLPISLEIILVNDASTDSTRGILSQYENKENYIVLHNEKNLGKSQTVKRGLLQSQGDLVVVHDADLEYNPENLKEFIELFQNYSFDVVYGNRFGKNNKVIYWKNWFGNRFLSLVSSFFTFFRAGVVTTDMEVCYKMAVGDIFRRIAVSIESESNFGIEPELTAKFTKVKFAGKKIKFKQIPIDYCPRTIAEGKHMHAIKDGCKALWEILKFNILR